MLDLSGRVQSLPIPRYNKRQGRHKATRDGLNQKGGVLNQARRPLVQPVRLTNRSEAELEEKCLPLFPVGVGLRVLNA